MSRKNREAKTERRLAKSADALLVPAAADGAPPVARADWGPGWNGLGGGLSGGYQGADFNRLRGYVYFPQLDTRVAVSQFTRTEMLRRARFLYVNYGIARRMVDGIARMIAGTGLTPHGTTSDELFNRAARQYWNDYANSRFSYDLGGRYNCAGSQYNLTRFKLRDGDYFQAFARQPDGSPSNAFYEGHQCGGGGNLGSPVGYAQDPRLGMDANTFDGVIVGQNNRAVGYRMFDAKNEWVTIDARDMIFGCDYQTAGQRRGLTIFHHAINNLLDAAEIQGFIKAGVKLANQFGYWVEAPVGGPSATTAAERIGGGRTRTIPTKDGPITLEQITGGGAIPQLDAGQSIKFANSQHPHPNNLTLIDYLIRDVAWGAGISPEILWNIAALGGANTRFVMADAQGWISLQQQDLVDTKLGREWVTVIGDAMARGKIAKCTDPRWWTHEWIPPARLTVDIGRDGKLYLEQLKVCALTYKQFYGWQGLDYKEQIDQGLDELKYFKDGLDSRGLTWDDWARMRNSSGNGVATADTPTSDSVTNPGVTGDDSPMPEDGADASARLAWLAKHPKQAEAFMRSMMAQAA